MISALPGWVELLVPCTREAAGQIEQVVERCWARTFRRKCSESVVFAFRELVMNAVEWGGELDPRRKVRITCVRTNRMLMYRIADPGPGFRLENLDHAAIATRRSHRAHEIRDEKGLRAGGFGLLTGSREGR